MLIKYTFTNQEIEEIKVAMRSEKNVVVKERLLAIHMTMQGAKRYVVAHHLGRGEDFVGKWVKRYKKEGIKALCEKRGGANNQYLTEEQELFIKDIVSHSLPVDCNYNSPVWSGALLVDLIESLYQKRYTRNGVYALLERLDLSYKKASKRDPKKSQKVIKEWKELTKKTRKNRFREL